MSPPVRPAVRSPQPLIRLPRDLRTGNANRYQWRTMVYGVPSRRDLLLVAAGSAGLLVPRRLLALAPGGRMTPEMFGARGDGRTDDYDALRRMAAAASGTSGTTILFGRNRRYRIDRVRVTAGPHKNDVSEIAFHNCSDLTIDLNGSTIDVKGDFHRPISRKTKRHAFSFVQQVEPLVFRDCTGVTIQNGSMTGNADKTTRDPGVVEGTGRGIRIQGCSNVLLQDLDIRRFCTDGIQIYPNPLGQVSDGIRLRRVRSRNNARQGLSNSGGIGVTAIDCEFSENGIPGGAYRHAPAAGVDIEPNRFFSQRSDFSGRRCRFDDNLGVPFAAGNPDTDDVVELIDCGATSDTQRQLILSAERCLIQGGRWHNIQIACAYAAHRPFEHHITVEVSGGIWTGDDPKWAPVYDLSPRRPTTYIHDNRFELRSPRPMLTRSLFRCANPNHRFERNAIFVAGTGHDASNARLIGQFDKAHVRGNHWSTDVKPPARFVNSYRDADVEGESFAGSFGALGGSPYRSQGQPP